MAHDINPPDGWPAIQSLIGLAFHDDADMADLACRELLDRIDLPVIPLVHDDGRTILLRRKEQLQ